MALWLEALEPGRPLSFLDAHIKVGNALLGATPDLVDNGLPEAAFAALDGDDSTTLSKRRRRNREETIHSEQVELDFGTPSPDFGKAFQQLADAPEHTLTDVHAKAAAWQAAEEDPALAKARLAADAWCAAFVWNHQPDTTPGLTAGDIRRIFNQGPTGIQPEQLAEVHRLRDSYRFFHWHLEFPDVLPGGFTCVAGNPPWEQMELQEKQFFAASAPEIANAKTASKRKKLVAALRAERPALWKQYRQAVRETESENILVRASGRYPLTARGRMNTYALFAEAALSIVAKRGRAGMVLETAIATGDTTAPFFRKLVETNTLASFLDFENEAKIFPDVTNRFRFAILVVTGGIAVEAASFAFSTRHVHELPTRRFNLHPAEILQVNPNSGTSPIFKSRRHAEITINIHRRLKIFWHDDAVDGNLWKVRFSQGLFNMATDSNIFRDEDALRSEGWTPEGNSFVREDTVMLPLYEAKMTRYFDHRFATYTGATKAQIKKGTLPRVTPEDHCDPDVTSWPQHWVSKSDVDRELAAKWQKDWLFGWRDIAKDTDERTMIVSVIPRAGVGHTFPLLFSAIETQACLYANMAALAFDYCARAKLSGSHLTQTLLKQLPVVSPDAYDIAAPWQDNGTLSDWITMRVLELSYTSWSLQGYARDLGDNGPPFQWNEERRAQLRAELDGAYLHLYGLDRDDAEHVINSFFVLRKNEVRQYGEFRTRRLVLAAYDAIAEGQFVSPLDPAPGHGHRHPDRRS